MVRFTLGAICLFLAGCEMEDANMVDVTQNVEWMNRLAYVEGIQPVASDNCGPFRVELFANREVDIGQPLEFAVQQSLYPVPVYFSGLAVRITKPSGFNGGGLEYRYVPINNSTFEVAERIEWRAADGRWVDVTAPFSFVTSHGPQKSEWKSILNTPSTLAEQRAGATVNSFWDDKFVYSLPFGDVLQHVSRLAQDGDRFRLVNPHPVMLRWQGEICTIPVPNAEFQVVGDF